MELKGNTPDLQTCTFALFWCKNGKVYANQVDKVGKAPCLVKFAEEVIEKPAEKIPDYFVKLTEKTIRFPELSTDSKGKTGLLDRNRPF